VIVWIKNGGTPNSWEIFHQGILGVSKVWGVKPGRPEVWGYYNYFADNGGKSFAFELDTWHHFGVTWDGVNYAFYFDGLLWASGTHSQAFATSGGAFYGGPHESAAAGREYLFFKGEASDLRYWSKALSIEEVAYYAGLPRSVA